MKIKSIHITLMLCGLLLCLHTAQGQDNPWVSHGNLLIEARGHFGAFYHHHFEMERFNAHFPAFEVSLYSKTFGTKEWHKLYQFPYVGGTFYFSNLGGFPELGKVFALYPFINFPLLVGQTGQLTLKVGAGLAWLTNKFDHINNYHNFSIGSHLNAAVNLSFEYRQEITDRLLAVGSVGLTHFSNGATKSPNYGLNTISGALGLAYYLRPQHQSFTLTKRPDYYPFEFDGKNWFFIDLGYGVGVKDVSQTLGKQERYLVHEISAQFLAQFTQCSSAGVTLSLVQDNSDQALLNHYVDEKKNIYILQFDEGTQNYDTIAIKAYQMVKPNVGVCYSMTLNRLSFNFELGYHIDLRKRSNQKYICETRPDGTLCIPTIALATDLSRGQFYQKLALRYRLYDQIFATVSLCAHAFRADYLCFGISYRFNEKYYLNKYEKRYRRPPGLD